MTNGAPDPGRGASKMAPMGVTAMRATSIGHAGILIETGRGSVLCDPWFVPAFFGSWFVFPRNDRLPPALMAAIERPDFLYLSHLHGDHFDEAFLADHVDRATTVLLPAFPGDELEANLRRLGFTRFVHTEPGAPITLDTGLVVEIHVETSLTDGPGGDSALLVDDGTARLLDQNDCRLNDLGAVLTGGPIDCHWLQYSGAIWYPMVYDETDDVKRELARAKVEAQFARAVRYARSIGARAVVPSAGPPCFLDPELARWNWVDGSEISIFPDATHFLARLYDAGIDSGRLVVPGSTVTVTPSDIDVAHPAPTAAALRPFTDKRAELAEYAADWSGWLADERASWREPTPTALEELAEWWEPLLARAPTLRQSVGSVCRMRADDLDIAIDFPAGRVRPFVAGEDHAFRFDIPRPLLETVLARRAVDWSNALFLSLRFRAWRQGEFNEHLYNFFKSLSPERIVRAEAQARADAAPGRAGDEVRIGDWVVQRHCPHRQADLAVFGDLDGCVLTCTLHGWQFDLETGRCLTADRPIRARPAGHDEEIVRAAS